MKLRYIILWAIIILILCTIIGLALPPSELAQSCPNCTEMIP
jgi:hypothetical protein